MIILIWYTHSLKIRFFFDCIRSPQMHIYGSTLQGFTISNHIPSHPGVVSKGIHRFPVTKGYIVEMHYHVPHRSFMGWPSQPVILSVSAHNCNQSLSIQILQPSSPCLIQAADWMKCNAWFIAFQMHLHQKNCWKQTRFESWTPRIN